MILLRAGDGRVGEGKEEKFALVAARASRIRACSLARSTLYAAALARWFEGGEGREGDEWDWLRCTPAAKKKKGRQRRKKDKESADDDSSTDDLGGVCMAYDRVANPRIWAWALDGYYE